MSKKPLTIEDIDQLENKTPFELYRYCGFNNIPESAISSASTVQEIIQSIARFLEIPTVYSQFHGLLEDTTTQFALAREKLLGIIGNLADITNQLSSNDKELVAKLASTEAKQIADAADFFGKEFTLIVMGDTSSGKSTFVNMLLGETVLPTTALPCNTIVTEITYGEIPKLMAFDHDNGIILSVVLKPQEETQVESISELLRFTDHETWPPLYSRAVIEWPNPVLKLGLKLIDTPGVSEDNYLRNSATVEQIRRFIPSCVGLIFVINSSIGGISSHLADMIKHLSKISVQVAESDNVEKASNENDAIHIPAESDDSPFPRTGALFVCNKWDQVSKTHKEEEATNNGITATLQKNWPGVNAQEQIVHISAEEACDAISRKVLEPLRYRRFMPKFTSFFHNAIKARFISIVSLVQQCHWAVKFVVQASRRLPDLDYPTLLAKINDTKVYATNAIVKFKATVAEEMKKTVDTLQHNCDAQIDKVINPVVAQAAAAVASHSTMLTLTPILQRKLLASFKDFLSKQDEVFEKLLNDITKHASTAGTHGIAELIVNIESLQLTLFGCNVKPLQNNNSKSTILRNLIVGAKSFTNLIAEAVAMPLTLGFVANILGAHLKFALQGHLRAFNIDPWGQVREFCRDQLKQWFEHIRDHWKMDYSESYEGQAMHRLGVEKPDSSIALAVLETQCSTAAFNKLCQKILRDISILKFKVSEQMRAKEVIVYDNEISDKVQSLDGELALLQIRFAKEFEAIPSQDVQKKKFVAGGASGVVFAGICKQQQVALKFVKDPTTQEIEWRPSNDVAIAISEFLQEVQILSGLQHNHIITCYGWSCTPYSDTTMLSCCIVLEECAMSLASKLTEPPPRSLDRKWLRYAIQIARGMAYLHSLSLMHRDLKPENILLSLQGEIKIADVGNSKRTHEANMTYCGTPAYMAPEVKLQCYSLSADVYSFGLVLWELYYWKRIPFTTNLNNLPSDTPPQRLNTLIRECWDVVERKRPSFTDIEKRLVELDSGVIYELLMS